MAGSHTGLAMLYSSGPPRPSLSPEVIAAVCARLPYTGLVPATETLPAGREAVGTFAVLEKVTETSKVSSWSTSTV